MIVYIDPLAVADITNGTFDGGKGLGNLYRSQITAFGALTGNGHSIYFRDDRCFRGVGQSFMTFRFQAKNDLVFGNYGDGNEKPLLCGWVWHEPAVHDNLWTHTGNGIWACDALNAHGASGRCFRMMFGARFSNDRSLYQFGTGLGSPFLLSDIQSHPDLVWWGLGSAPWTVSCYTGSPTVAPPSYYGGVAMLQVGTSTVFSSATGAILGFRNGCNRININNLAFDGGITALGCVDQSNGAANEDWVFEDITIERAGKQAIAAPIIGTTQLAAGAVIRRWKVSRLRSYFRETPSERMDTAADYYLNNASNFAISPMVQGLHVDDYELSGMFHGAIESNVQDVQYNAGFKPRNVLFTRGKITCTSELLQRAMSISSGDNIVIDGVRITKQTTRSQIGGTNFRLANAHYTDTRISFLSPDDSADIIRVRSPSGPIENVTVEFVTIDTRNRTHWTAGGQDRFGAAMSHSNYTGEIHPGVNQINIRNNLFLLPNDAQWIQFVGSGYDASNGSPMPNVQNVSDNDLCRLDGSTPNVAIHRSGTFGTNVSYHSRGLIGDTRNLSPTIESLNLDDRLRPSPGNAGIYTGSHHDMTGAARSFTPTRGALERIAPRLPSPSF